MSGKPRPPLPLTPDQKQQIAQDRNQNVVGKNGDNTDEYTPNKFYNDDGLSRTSERRDQPQRRRSDNRSRQYQQYAQYAQNITASPQDSNQSPQNFVEQDASDESLTTPDAT
ncbi:15886_t:CDS:2, partial [Racocetra fulgida]